MRITFTLPPRRDPEPPASDEPIDLSAYGLSAEDLLLTDEEIAQIAAEQRRYRPRRRRGEA